MGEVGSVQGGGDHLRAVGLGHTEGRHIKGRPTTNVQFECHLGLFISPPAKTAFCWLKKYF
jgi:hypothetical protein